MWEKIKMGIVLFLVICAFLALCTFLYNVIVIFGSFISEDIKDHKEKTAIIEKYNLKEGQKVTVDGKIVTIVNREFFDDDVFEIRYLDGTISKTTFQELTKEDPNSR